MKQKQSLIAALAITGLAAFGAPKASEAAYAGTTADATLLNVVKVTYKDASNTQNFEASAKTTVTVNLVKSPLIASAPPTDVNGGPAFSCPPAYSIDSGSSVSYLYALTASANGDDNYKFSMPVPTGLNVVTPTATSVSWYFVNPATGEDSLANLATRVLGAGTPVGFKGTADAAEKATLLFPGGALAGFEAGDIVVVNQAGLGKRAYLVDGDPVVGNAAGHTAGSKTNGVGAGMTDVAEVKGELKLKALPVTTISVNGTNDTTFGGTLDPDFSANAPVVGEPVGEMVLVKVTATATVNVFNANGTVTYSLNTTDSANGNGTALPGATTCPAGNFQGVGLTITKEVRNTATDGATSFYPNRSGNPGEILEYKITVQNAKGKANAVRVTDAVPVYTTLVAGPSYGTVGTAEAAHIFAKATKNGGPEVNLTVQSSDTENAAVVSGNGNTGSVLAGQTLTFFVGTGNSNLAGGTVDNTSVYHIYYRVKID